MPPLFCWAESAADGLPPRSEANGEGPPIGGGGVYPHVTSEFAEAPHPSALRAATLPTARLRRLGEGKNGALLLEPDPLLEAPRLPHRDQHHARLLTKLPVEIHRARIAMPWLDAEKRRP